MPDPVQNPSNSDIAAQNSLQTTPSVVSDNQIPQPTAPAANQPTAPNAVQPNATAPVVRPPAPTPSPTPQQLHTSIFTKILGTLAGGSNRPVMGPNGQPQTDANGNVVMAPASKKALGASILAGALSAMVAGYAAPSKFNEVAPGRFQQDFSGSAAAGAAAGQKFTQAGSQAEAQGQVDANQARLYTTTKHNLDMHVATLNALRMQGEAFQAGLATDKPVVDALQLAQLAGNLTDDKGNPANVILDQGVTEDALQAGMASGKYHVTVQQTMRDGVINSVDAQGKQILNPDGTPHQQYTYTIYNPQALLALTPEIQQLAPKGQLDNVALGTGVPAQVAAKYVIQRSNQANGQAVINGMISQQNEINKSKGRPAIDPVKISSVLAKYPYLNSIMPNLGLYSGMDPAAAVAKMVKDGVDANAIGAFSNAIGNPNADEWAVKNDADKKLAEGAAKPINSVGEAMSVKTDPTATETRKQQATDYLNESDRRAVAVDDEKNRASEARATTTQDRKDARAQVYAQVDGKLILTNLHDHPEGDVVKSSDVMKDRTAMRQLNDVQINLSRYSQAIANDMPKMTNNDRDKLTEILALTKNADNGVIASAGGISLNVPVISAKLSKQNAQQLASDLQALTPSARNVLNGYLRTAASVPAYQKALTGIGRSNKEMLDLELANVPMPYFDNTTAKERADMFQENVDRASSGYPTNLQGMVHPSTLKPRPAPPAGFAPVSQ